MTEQYAVAGLLRKRRNLMEQVEAHKTALRQLVADIESLDATLRLFDPTIDLEEIRPSAAMPWQQSYRGEFFRAVLDTLRTAERPFTAYEIAMHVMAKKQLNTADKRLAARFDRRISAVLRYHRERGKVRSMPGMDQRVLWELVR